MRGERYRIGVVGGGHAGVEAALKAAQSGCEVCLFSTEPDLPYFRPRIVAVAFGETEEASIRMHPEAWFPSNGIRLHLGSRIDAIDAKTKTTVLAAGTRQSFDALVIATGAMAASPRFVAPDDNAVLPLWTLAHARLMRARMGDGRRMAVIGGGIIGIEAAVRAAGVGMRVAIVEKMDRLMREELSPRGSDVLRKRLEGKGIAVYLGTGVASIERTAEERRVVLAGGATWTADMVLVCVGAVRDLGLARSAGIATGRGIVVDGALRTSSPSIYACGDIAEIEGGVRCLASEAVAQGRVAGANAVASLSGGAGDQYRARRLPLFMRCGDIEVRVAGTANVIGGKEQPLDGLDSSSHRACIVKDGKIVGVEMVGNTGDFQAYAQRIGSEWPPV